VRQHEAIRNPSLDFNMESGVRQNDDCGRDPGQTTFLFRAKQGLSLITQAQPAVTRAAYLHAAYSGFM